MNERKPTVKSSTPASPNPAKSVKPTPLPTKETRGDGHGTIKK